VITSTRRRRRWWLGAAAGGWALLLVGLAAYDNEASVRDQRPIGTALPVVDRVAGELFAAAGPQRVAEVLPMGRPRGCRVTPVRDGVTVEREVRVHVRPGDGPGLLDAVRAALPAAYRASVWHRPDGTEHVLSADAGDFVAVAGEVLAEGALVRLTASSGCRPLDGPVPADAGSTGPGPQLVEVAQRLGVPVPTAATWAELTCPGGTRVRSFVAETGPSPADLGGALRGQLAGATVARAEPRAYAYRRGAVSIVVTARDDRVRLSTTTGCQ
jgi:hypothetical protein